MGFKQHGLRRTDLFAELKLMKCGYAQCMSEALVSIGRGLEKRTKGKILTLFSHRFICKIKNQADGLKNCRFLKTLHK